MRLWHKKMIRCLPRKQLLRQWRDCCIIASNLAKNHSAKDVLINRIMDYSLEHFSFFCNLVFDEIKDRKYRVQEKTFNKLVSDVEKAKNCWSQRFSPHVSFNNLFYFWHNEKYLRQCFYNLEELSKSDNYTAHAYVWFVR